MNMAPELLVCMGVAPELSFFITWLRLLSFLGHGRQDFFHVVAKKSRVEKILRPEGKNIFNCLGRRQEFFQRGNSRFFQSGQKW